MDVAIHVPSNRADQHGVPIQTTTHDIDRATLENALSLTADHIRHRNAQVTVIAVGGAVNAMLLRTRNTTHDVDIFGSNLNNAARVLLDEAMQYAIQHSPTPLGTAWFNTETQMWMSPALHQELTNRALHRNVVVFSRPGLTVLAAPWDYAFSAKVSRLLTGGSQIRPYDLIDAVHYLNQFINQHDG